MAGDIKPIESTPTTQPTKSSRLGYLKGRVRQRIAEDEETLRRMGGNPDVLPPRYKLKQAVRSVGGEERSSTDFLTGLGAKRLYESTLRQEIASVNRERRSFPLELTVMDLDDFGKFNKKYGNPAGDEVLKTVGTTILKTLRESDQAFRIGGEELVVVSRRTHDPERSGSRTVSERLNEAISAARTEQGFQVTVSAGQTDYIPGEDQATFYRRANTAELVAKFLGKNRAVIGEVINERDVFTDTITGKTYTAFFNDTGEFVGAEEIING